MAVANYCPTSGPPNYSDGNMTGTNLVSATLQLVFVHDLSDDREETWTAKITDNENPGLGQFCHKNSAKLEY